MSKPEWMIADERKVTVQRTRASKIPKVKDPILMAKIFDRHTELEAVFGMNNKRVVNRKMREEFNLLDVDHVVAKVKAFRYKDC